MNRKKRHPIVDDYENPPKNWKSLVGKECLLSDQNGCSAESRKYQIIVWGPDSYQDEPHFHVIDTETRGNVVNAAYSMLTGKFMNHGSVIGPLIKRQLSWTQKMINDGDRYQSMMIDWDMFNKKGYQFYKKHKKVSIPMLSNS